MKALKLILVTLLIAISFFIGRYYKTLLDHPIPEGQIVICQEIHDWSIDRDRDTKPVYITIFAKNEKDLDISGPIQFEINLDPSGLEKSFIDSLISIVGEDRLIKEPGTTAKFKAIAAYIKRGKKLPEGMEYEPIVAKNNQGYSTTVTTEISLKAGETKKIKIEAMIPPNVRGYVLNIKQK